MGYIVQSIVFDKDKGWDMKTAREWVKNHKEFSKPIKEEETVNTIRVRLFPPKKAEQMGFTDYRMKTLASGDVGIMLDIAYNKLEGGANEETIEYEEEDPTYDLRVENYNIAKNYDEAYQELVVLDNMRRRFPEIESEERIEIDDDIRKLETFLSKSVEKINANNEEIQRIERRLHPTGGGTGSSKVAVTDEEDAPNEKDKAFDENTKLFEEGDKLEKLLLNIEKKLKKRMELRKRVLLEAEKEKIIAQLQEIENKMAENFQILNGGSLANEDLQALLSKSYHSKHPSDYKDFIVDKELSGQRVQVYHNPTTQQTIVAHRGTASAPNWIENVAYAVSNNKSGKAFQHSKKIQDQAYSKYGKENITTIGHSKGALHAQEYGKEGKEVITLNKPVNITDALFTRVPKSQTDIRTQYDPVSFLRPFQRGNKAETIKSTTKNPLAEHKTSVLGRLDPRRLFGSAVKKPPIKEQGEDKNPATTTIQELEQQALQAQMLQQNRATVNNILGQEINNITQLFRRQREDRLSLQEGLVPEFLLDEQIRYANVTDLAQRLREAILEQVTADTVINPQQIASNYRRIFTDNLRSILINNNAERRAGEPNPFVPISEGSGMMCSCCGVNCNCGMMRGGMSGGANNIRISTNETTYVIDLSDKERFYYTALPYVNNTHIRIYPTEEGNISIHEFLDNLNNRDPEWDNYYQRTIVPTIISKMRTTDSTDTYYKLSVFRGNISAWADVLENYIDFAAEREGDYPTAPPTPYESDEDEDEVQNPLQGEGMSGGVSIQFNNGLVEFNTSSPSSFYKSIRAYYFRERPNRRQQYQQAVRDAPNFVRQQEKSIVRDFRNNWNEFLDVLNGDSEIEKRRIVGTTELDIGGIIDAVNDGSVYTESEGALSSGEEGAGMTGGIGEFDIELGNQVERALRDAKRRWAKSPKLFENLEYERRMFNARYGHLMRHIQVHTGMGGMDLRLFRALLNYSGWVRGLEIPDTSYTPVSRGAGKKAKKTGKSKK